MKLYQARVSQIAHDVIATLTQDGHIDVAPENRQEAEQDLVAIMDEYLRRDRTLRDNIREHMHDNAIPYDQYGKVRGRLAGQWGHPLNDDVERFLARQFAENFMISNFIDEVYSEDAVIYKRLLEIIRKHHVDEQAIRDEARERIKNIKEGTMEYEIAMESAMREVKKRYGLISEREDQPRRGPPR